MTGTKRSNAQRLRDSLEDDIINGRRLPGERWTRKPWGVSFRSREHPCVKLFSSW